MAIGAQKELPRVSVIVPSYNHVGYIEQCIASIVGQTYSNIELIVIDDGSSDNSRQMLMDLSRLHGFKYIEQQNRGLSATLNRGIKEFATGKYIAVVASDDWWATDKIERQVAYLESNPDKVLCYGKATKVDEHGNMLMEFGRKPATENVFDDLIRNDSFIPALTVMLRRSVFDEVGYFDEKSYIEDWDLWLRISEKHKIGFIDQNLAYYRAHSSSLSSKMDKMMLAILTILEKWGHIENFDSIRKDWYLKTFNRLSRKHKALAVKYMVRSASRFYHILFLKGVFKLMFVFK